MTPGFRMALMASSSLTPLTTGEVLYTTAGSYTFTAQYTGAHWVCCQGPGGGGASSGSDAGGGGGGANAWARFDMVQGQTATVVVGVPGAAQSGTAAGNDATDSSFTIDGSHYLIAEGGEGGKLSSLQTGQASYSVLGNVSSPGVGFGGRGGRGYAGGSGGGGGAGGPAGTGGAGGDGGDVVVDNAEDGTGGGGGGGGQATGAGQPGGGGGGVSFLNSGSNGTAGAAGAGGTGGSGGATGKSAGDSPIGNGGDYGGGGGGGDGRGAPGGGGFVRIIWGTGRSWPNDAAAVPLLASFDFRANKARLSGIRYPNLAAAITNKVVSFARTGAAFGLKADGTLQSFADGQPRVTDLGFLAEEGRTNLLLRSQEFDNASWVKLAVTVSANAVTAPDGTLTADKLVEDATTNQHNVAQAVASKVSGATYTFTAYFKAAERTKAQLYLNGSFNTGGANGTFDLSAVTATPSGHASTTASITALGDGWYKCSITATAATNTTGFAAYVFLVNAAGSNNYAGSAGSGLYVWGAQLEAGAFATSYIPTTTAAATRGPDDFSLGTSALPPEGTIIIKYVVPPAAVGNAARTYGWFGLDTGNSRFALRTGDVGSPTTPLAVCGDGSAISSLTGASLTAGSVAKIAVAYSTLSAQFAMCVNGVDQTAARQLATAALAYNLRLAGISGPNSLNSPVQSFEIHPRFMSSGERIGLTS